MVDCCPWLCQPSAGTHRLAGLPSSAGHAGEASAVRPQDISRVMPYVLADESFRTKKHITDRCREILSATPDGSPVNDNTLPFLLDLFKHHDEWSQKAAGGVVGISTQTTSHGTRCFILMRNGEDTIDISFPHATRLTPSTRTADLIPQGL